MKSTERGKIQAIFVFANGQVETTRMPDSIHRTYNNVTAASHTRITRIGHVKYHMRALIEGSQIKLISIWRN